MADETKGPEQSQPGTPTIPETPAPTTPQKGQGSWTPEQQAENTRKLQAHADLVKKAEAQGYDDPVQYLADLESSNTDLTNQVQQLNFNEPNVDTPAETATEIKTEVEQPQYDDNKIKALQATNFTATLKSDWNEYRVDQSELKDEQKYEFDKVKIKAFMNDNVGLMTQRYVDQHRLNGDANYYQIAADEMAFRSFQKNKGVAPAPTETVTTTPAEQTASVEQSTGDPAPDKKTPNDKAADEIAEDTVYIPPEE